MFLNSFRRILSPYGSFLVNSHLRKCLLTTEVCIIGSVPNFHYNTFRFSKKGPFFNLYNKKPWSSPVMLNCLLTCENSTKGDVTGRENIWTIPNILCVTRIAVSPYLGYLIIDAAYHQAFYIILFAGVTDILDGYIARNWYNQSSKLGSFLDPMADKILIITLFSTMSYANLIPTLLSTLIIARDISLIAAAFYIRYISLPVPRNLFQYFDASLATAQLEPTTISKFNTVVQLATVMVTLSASVFSFTEHPILPYLWYLAGATTIASSASYIFSKNTYKILKKEQVKK